MVKVIAIRMYNFNFIVLFLRLRPTHLLTYFISLEWIKSCICANAIFIMVKLAHEPQYAICMLGDSFPIT